ncbi:hypothetical protein JCM10908_003392 [Rhodotorula pacifica]|uniref:uncharacterized protein n=1 Tax=Rhodotorula pacifica TaxID=1495444 RepID=UPI00317DC289
MSSANSTSAPDRFTTLPVELFEIIVHLAQAEEGCPYLVLVSKAFLPFARQRRFEDVTVKSYAQLDKLCGMHKCTRYIDELTIDMDAQVDYGVPRDARLKTLFRRLTSVRFLVILSSIRLIKTVLAPPTAATLPNLAVLGIADGFEKIPHPFSPELYASLATYAKLSTLSITHRGYRRGYQLPSERVTYKGKPIPELGGDRIWTLDLIGELSGSTAARHLVSSFANIADLSLWDTSSEQDAKSLTDFRSAIRNPNGVKILSLSTPLWDFAPRLGLREIVEHLPQLEHLTFAGAAFRAWLLPTMATLTSLRTISFAADSDVCDVELAALLGGPNRLTQIREVYLDLGQEAYRHARRRQGRLTKQGMVYCVGLAEEYGVEMEGELVEKARAAMQQQGI